MLGNHLNESLRARKRRGKLALVLVAGIVGAVVVAAGVWWATGPRPDEGGAVAAESTAADSSSTDPESADAEPSSAASVADRAADSASASGVAERSGAAPSPGSGDRAAGSGSADSADTAGAAGAAAPGAGSGSGSSAATPPSWPMSLGPVAPEMFESGVEPVDASRRVARPDSVRGVYVNAWSAGSSRRLAALVALADTTELNTFVVDIKDASGRVSYPSAVPFVDRIGADEEVRIRDPRALLDTLRAHDIYPIARIVVFKDPYLAERRPDWAIHHVDGGVWRDHNDEVWVDPYNANVWSYNIGLAREAAALGFAEVQWDYVRFPDVPREYMEAAVFPAREGRIRVDAIRTFLRRSDEALADLDVPLTADVFGLTVSARNDMGIGQSWDRMVDVTDVLLPMIYPSHFAPGSYGIPQPNAAPYRTITTAIRHARSRTDSIPGGAEIRPWLQDFTLGDPAYGPAHVRAQITAVHDAGLTSWVLWNSSSRYTAEALAPEDGPPPKFPLPDRPVAAGAADTLPKPKIEMVAPAPVLGVPAVKDTPAAPDTTGGAAGAAPDTTDASADTVSTPPAAAPDTVGGFSRRRPPRR
ncbi:MAG: putative glycoside hydrolase [Gemmatimonadota bacterium]